jgi:Flp pilus assembly protein TadG
VPPAQGTSVNRNSAVRPAFRLGGLLARLRRDSRGNTLILVAISLLPLLAMIGSGIDMGRGYLAQSRLQQACDAAALAGRRAMTGGVLDDTVRAEAAKFFKFNFPTGTVDAEGTAAFQAKGFAPIIGSAANSTVTVSARTTLPTTVMKFFGFNTLPLSVDCFAKQDFVNTDIVLVLDVTASMLCAPTENNCPETTTKSEKGSSKIRALRSAVLALYDELAKTQTELEAAGMRLRYGIVPYSSSVNVGDAVISANPSYIASDNWDYQSREVTKSAPGEISPYYCTAGSRYGSYNYTTRVCTYFTYKQRNFQLADYVASLKDPSRAVETSSLIGTSDSSGDTPATASLNYSRWDGCIEERQSTNTMTASATSIPAEAKDLSIDLIPTADKTTKWKPYWSDIEYMPTQANLGYKEANKPQYACPTPAKRLQAWTRSDLSNYLNTLAPNGGTYHDNGMIWGGRFISPDGIFGGNNPSTYNNMPVARHIIFMTDGLLDTGYDALYTTYGIEKYDARVTAGGSASNETQQGERHQQRFNLMCSAVKAKKVSIWVVAFASALDSNLTTCATSAAQASTSANTTDLTAKFVEIGKNIGSLRLVKP